MTTPAGSRVQPGGEPPNKGGRYPAEPLTPAEVAAILAQTAGPSPTPVRNRALLYLLYRSGLRVSEVLSLRVADVDFARHSIRLRDTKSGEPQTRGFHPSAEDSLKRWIDKRKQLGIRANGHPLFCTLRGEPMSSDYVRHMVRRLAAKAGIDKRVSPHGLRHTFAVELEQSGTPVTVISKLLGHSTVAVTARYLDHLTNGQAVEALQAAGLPDVGVAGRVARLLSHERQVKAGKGPGQPDVAAYLRARGIRITGREDPDDLMEAYSNLRDAEDEPEL